MRINSQDRSEKAGPSRFGHFFLPFIFIALAAAAVILLHKPSAPVPGRTAVVPAAVPENISAGDVIIFGAYEQDNDRENGPEPVEWQVLAVEDGRALLISKYALDAKPYNTNWIRRTWEGCSLRKWLNREFINSAFDPAEQASIMTVTNVNPDHPITGMKGGHDTEDRIFLLTIDEAEDLFPSDEARRCRATAYAKANGSYVNEYKGSSWYWLRSRGAYSLTGSLVLFSGYINTVGYGVNNTGGYVRPAMWVRL